MRTTGLLSPEATNMLLGRRPAEVYEPAQRKTVAVIIPAYNEHASIAMTVRSVQRQTYPVTEIIVVDDCSPDPRTGEIARALGVTVVRTPVNQGTKARAQNFVLPTVTAEYLFTIDGDTMLEPDAVEEAMRFFNNKDTGTVCGFIIPKRVETLWERGRFIEYLYALRIVKPGQDNVGAVMVSSGCFSGFKTEVLKELGGFHPTNMAEDMYFTWDLAGKTSYRAYFTPKALCRPIEPPTLKIYWNQVYRWDCGLLQNIAVRVTEPGERMNLYKAYRRAPLLVSKIGKRLGWLLYFYLTTTLVGILLLPFYVVGLWWLLDSMVAGTISWTTLLVGFGIYVSLQAVLIWIPIILVASRLKEVVRKKTLRRSTRALLRITTLLPRLKKVAVVRQFAARSTYGPEEVRRMTKKALASIPAFFVMGMVNKAIFVVALFNEWVQNKSLVEWKKGH